MEILCILLLSLVMIFNGSFFVWHWHWVFCGAVCFIINVILINVIFVVIFVIEFFVDVIAVNITCMMVLSSIYIAVSGSLPVTSSIKYVEIWLLFSLIYPFLVVLIKTFIH